MKKRVAGLIIALTVLVSIAAGYYGWRYWQFKSDEVATVALSVEVDRRTVTGKNLTAMPWRYTAQYTFADRSGTVHSGRQSIDRSMYDVLTRRAAGTPVAIYYSRSKPYINTLVANGPRNTAAVLALIALFGWVLVVWRGMRG